MEMILLILNSSNKLQFIKEDTTLKLKQLSNKYFIIKQTIMVNFAFS